jgi:hypothetical protein
MENMLSRNSFPQICVVSVIQCVGNLDIQQEYVGSGSLGNQYVYSLVNPPARPTATPGEPSLVMRDDGTQKKRSSRCISEKMRSGTPFPRSALFLETVCAKVDFFTWSKLLSF